MNQRDQIRIINWNARSLWNKRPDLESLIQRFQPQIITITETWFTDGRPFSIYGYHIHRKDRAGGRGGGVAIMVAEDLITTPLRIEFTNPREFHLLDHLGVKVSTGTGSLEVMVVYCPLGTKLEVDDWKELIEPTNSGGARITCGDFNAHSGTWGASRSNNRGNRLSEALSLCDMIPINDTTPTHVASPGCINNNLDLIFVSAGLIPQCSARVVLDLYTSDHLPVICDLSLRLPLIESSTSRINVKKVDWNKFRTQMEERTGERYEEEQPNMEYSKLITTTREVLMECGARAPGTCKGKKKIQPLCWNENCDNLITERRRALKYTLCPKQEETLWNISGLTIESRGSYGKSNRNLLKNSVIILISNRVSPTFGSE